MDPSLVDLGTKVAVGVATRLATDIASKGLYKVIEKSAYGSVQVVVFLVMDFVEPLRLDEWGTQLNSILTKTGFRKDGNEYVAENQVRIKDIAVEYFSLLPDLDDTELEEGSDPIDEGVLLVKRMKIYAIPEREAEKSLSETALKLAEIAEEFLQAINLKKTFIGVKIVFKGGGSAEAGKFKYEVEKKLKEIEARYILYHTDKEVDILVIGLTKVLPVFEVVESELFAGFLHKLKRRITG